MKKTNAFFYVLLAIIIVGIFSFLSLEKGDKLSINYLVETRKANTLSEDYGLIYQKILKNTELSLGQLEYEVNYFEDYSGFDKQMKEVNRSESSNVMICQFEREETYDAFVKLNTLPQALFIILNEPEGGEQVQKKEILYLSPRSDLLAKAINELFKLEENHTLLLINNKKQSFRNTTFQTHLMGQKTTISIEEGEELKSRISSVGDILSTMNPDFLLIDLNEKLTIALLEKIVGFPRERIILLSENTSHQVGYYTGSNSYGINGITFTNPTQVKNFNNKTALLCSITQTLANCFVKGKKAGLNQLKQYLKVNPTTPFSINANQVITPIYRVSFTEKGIRVLNKAELIK